MKPSVATRLARGLIAGTAGTGAMTASQGLAVRLQADRSGNEARDQRDGATSSWQDAPAPAQVARRIVRAALRRDIAPQRIPALTNVMHWGYGISWGALYALFRRRPGGKSLLRGGAVFGSVVWGASYAQLVPMGIYEPPWRYPPAELALDATHHLVYGMATAACAAGLDAG